MLASPVLASKQDDKPLFDPFGRLSLIIGTQTALVTITTLIMIVNAQMFAFDVRGKHRQSNDNKRYIPGLSTPPLLRQSRNGERVGVVHLFETILVVNLLTLLSVARFNLMVGDGRTAYNLGRPGNLKRTAASQIPGLGNLPIVGGAFESRRQSNGRNNLIVMVHPTIIRES